MPTELMRVEGLVKQFKLKRRPFRRTQPTITAVDNVSLTLLRGESLGIVGESGCGKSTLSRAILRLVEPTAGRIIFRGRDITQLTHKDLRTERRHMQIVLQDPYGSLNPRKTIRELVGEPLRVHSLESRVTQLHRVIEILEVVGLAAHVLDRYPHEFSGGQRQRIAIARALVLNPDLVLGDEPVSALDVSVRAQILNLLKRLQARMGMSYLIVSHDLGAVSYICQRVAVMYLGRIVEEGPTQEVLARPLHPYTQALTAAVPSFRYRRTRPTAVAGGELPSTINPPTGCHFHPKCPHSEERCTRLTPALRELGSSRRVACHLY